MSVSRILEGDPIYKADCPSRAIIDQIADKWSMMILTVLRARPLRFNAIKRRLEGITQKALTQTLRRLERNGLVARRVIPVSPVQVQYAITPLGQTLHRPFAALYEWTLVHLSDIERARQDFDVRNSDDAEATPRAAHNSRRVTTEANGRRAAGEQERRTRHSAVRA